MLHFDNFSLQSNKKKKQFFLIDRSRNEFSRIWRKEKIGISNKNLLGWFLFNFTFSEILWEKLI